MKILFSAESLYPFYGGADISAFTLLEELSKKHEVHAVYVGEEKQSKIILHPQKIKRNKGIWVRSFLLNKKWEKILDSYIKQIKPDLIITQDLLAPSTIKLSKKYNIKSILFLRNYFHLSINGFLPIKNKKYLLQYPFFKLMLGKTKRALKNASLIISNSHYMKKITKNKLNIDSEVIYPFIDLKNYKTKPTGDYITLVNPDIHKGVNILKELAEKLPNKKFLAVGKQISGIESIPKTDDMKSIYKKTKILIVPSLWPEPFGRVCVEAMISGIPCIVSMKGGLPEAIGDSGFTANNIDNWIFAIKELEKKEVYKKFSKKAVEHAKKFDFKKQFEKFESFL